MIKTKQKKIVEDVTKTTIIDGEGEIEKENNKTVKLY